MMEVDVGVRVVAFYWMIFWVWLVVVVEIGEVKKIEHFGTVSS